MSNRKIPALLLVLLFGMQVLLWFFTYRIKPSFMITPYPPTSMEIKALSFGDEQFLYRKLVFTLQNAGDKVGQTTNINNYDYNRIKRWFVALDKMDLKSEYIPYMAAYYYSYVRKEENSKMIAQYIVDYAKRDPQKHWRMLTTAAYIYFKKVANSNQEIQEIGDILVQQQNIPIWAKTLTAFYLNKNGDICTSYDLINRLSNDDMITEKANTKDHFLLDILEENINKLKQASYSSIIKCKANQ